MPAPIRAWIGPLLLVASTVAWFSPVREGAIAFDDVGAVIRWTDPAVGLADRSVLDTTANRWRPVFTSLFTVLTALFGKDYSSYFWFNVGLTALFVLLVYRLVLKVSGSRLLATALSLLTMTSRFAYYQVTQVIGPVEGLSLVFVVLLASGLVWFRAEARVRHLWAAVGWFTLLIHTHERYVVLAGFLAPLVLTETSLRVRVRLALATAFCGVVAFNLAIRAYALDLPLLVGSGSSTELGFTWRTGAEHLLFGGANVSGINVGPAYLDGLTFPALPVVFQVLSAVVTVVTVLLPLTAFALSRRPRGNWFTTDGPRRDLFMGAGLLLALLAAVSVTIRVEPRWLYAPFVVTVLLVAYSAALLGRRPRLLAPVVAAVAVLTAASVVLDETYGDHVEGVYFMSARAGTRDIVAQTVHAHGRNLERRPVFVVDPTPGADWQAVLSPIVAANSDLGPVAVTTVASVAQVPRGGWPLVYDVSGGFHEVGAPTTGGPTGVTTAGEAYADGWVGREFSLQGTCARLVLTVRPILPGPERFVAVSVGGQPAQRTALTTDSITLTYSRFDVAAGVVARFDRTFVPRDEGLGQDVRALAARVESTCS